MNNDELNQILKSASVPERPRDYWEQFPGLITSQVRREPSAAPQTSTAPMPAWRTWLPAFQFQRGLGVGLAAVFIAVALFVAFRKGQPSVPSDPQLSSAQKYFHEIEGLFPNQVQAIVFDQQGSRLLLADRPDVPASAPLYLKICDAKACRRFVTFSGQRIQINGDAFDVLVDRQGDVLLIGAQSVWSSSEPAEKAGRYRIEARPLLTKS